MFLTEEEIKIVEQRLQPLGVKYSPSYFYNNWYSKLIHQKFSKKWIRKLFRIKVDNQITNFIANFGFDTTVMSDIIEKEKKKWPKWKRQNYNFFNRIIPTEYTYNILGHYVPLGEFKGYTSDAPDMVKYHMSVERNYVNDSKFQFVLTFYEGVWQITTFTHPMLNTFDDSPDVDKLMNDLINNLCDVNRVDMWASTDGYRTAFRESNIDGLLEDC